MEGQLLSRMQQRDSAREKSSVKLLVATCHLCSHSSGQSKSYGRARRQRVHPSLRKAQQGIGLWGCVEAYWEGGVEGLRTRVTSTFKVDNLTTCPGQVPLGPSVKDGRACSNPCHSSSRVASDISTLGPFLHHRCHLSSPLKAHRPCLQVLRKSVLTAIKCCPMCV